MIEGPFVLDFFDQKIIYFIFIVFVSDLKKKIQSVKKIIFNVEMKLRVRASNLKKMIFMIVNKRKLATAFLENIYFILKQNHFL